MIVSLIKSCVLIVENLEHMKNVKKIKVTSDSTITDILMCFFPDFEQIFWQQFNKSSFKKYLPTSPFPWGSKEGCRVKSSLGYVDQGKPGTLQPVKVTTVAEPSDSGSKRLAMLWNVCPSPLFSSSSFSERQGHASKQQEEVGQCTNCTSSCGRVTIWLHL